MTLILTALAGSCVVQTSDRLVTRGSAPFDDLANKAIIYSAANAIVTISYTGLAFLGQLPTDEWIARHLFQFDFSDIPPTPSGGPPTIELNWHRPWPDIGKSVIALCGAISAAYALAPTSWRREPLRLVLAGWQWTKRLIGRPVLCIIEKSPAEDAFRYRWHSRRTKPTVRADPDGQVSPTDCESLRQRLLTSTVLEVPQMFAATIRDVASHSDKVGATAMSVVICAPTHPEAFFLFDSPTTVRLPLPIHPIPGLPAEAKTVSLPIAYSPWVVTSWLFQPPSAQAGSSSWIIKDGLYTIRQLRTADTSEAEAQGAVIYEIPQKRPLPPTP